MKPTEEELCGIYRKWLAENPSMTTGHLASRLNARWNEAWVEDEAEREQGRNALALVETYGRHKSACRALLGGYPCDCGWEDARATLRGDDGHGHASREYAPPPERARMYAAAEQYVRDEEVEQFNREQRIRREAYAAALDECGYIGMGGPRDRAAARYPLKRRVPVTIDDPHNGRYMWRYVPESNRFEWTKDEEWTPYRPSETTPITPERVRALYALLQSPWTSEDSTEIEETP